MSERSQMTGSRHFGQLYHLAEADNVPSILEHGLLSTEHLLALIGIDGPERLAFLRSYRNRRVLLKEGISVRDQCPMPPSALRRALNGGLEPGDWYAFLNGFVFLWPGRDRLERQRKACGDRAQIVLTFDAASLLADFGASAFVSPINSGNARRRPARRGFDTLVPYLTWLRDGWPTRPRSHPVAEIVFRRSIPTRPPYLVGVDRARHDGCSSRPSPGRSPLDQDETDAAC